MAKQIKSYQAWDKEGNLHIFRHAVDWKTVIRDKGFSSAPPGTQLPIEPEIKEGEAIDGIQLVNQSINIPEDKPETIEDIEIEKDPKIIIGERKPKGAKTKIER